MRHPLETSVSVAAALVAVAFGMSTLERWLRSRRAHELAWSVALALFALAAGALAYGAQAGWSGPVFRAFYLFGAIADVPVLALGSVYLLARKRVGTVTALVVLAFCAFAAGVVVTAPFRAPLPVNELVQGSKVFGPLPRVLAAVGSAGGALTIFGGALWSLVRVRRSGAPRHLLWSNSLIALGTLILGGSGTLNSVFGAMTAFAVTLLVGITVIFGGFLVATGQLGSGSTAASGATAPATATATATATHSTPGAPEAPGSREAPGSPETPATAEAPRASAPPATDRASQRPSATEVSA